MSQARALIPRTKAPALVGKRQMASAPECRRERVVTMASPRCCGGGAKRSRVRVG